MTLNSNPNMYSIEYQFIPMTEKRYAILTDLLLERWLRARNENLIVWKTNNGDEIPIKNLSDKHLDNSIDCMKKAYDIDDDEPFELVL